MDAVRPVGSGFSPLDEELALLPGAFSPPVQEAIVLLGASLPFRQAGQVLARVGRVTVSPSTVRRLTTRAGAALVAVEEQRVAEIERSWPAPSPGPVRQQVSVDGVMVPLRGGEWWEAKMLVIGALSATRPGTAEALSYLARLQDAEQFSRTATGELHRRGTFEAAQVVAVADGALWCQGLFDYHLPQAVRILDLPHALEHLHAAGQACWGQDSARARAWLQTQAHTLRHGDPQPVLTAVAELPVAQATDPAEAARVRERVLGYLQNRLPQLAYAAFAAQGFPLGSGIVESANKVGVEARLKGGGMHWHEDTVDGMLALRCALASQRWAEVWPQLAQQRHRAARRTTPRPPILLSAPPTPVTGSARVLPAPQPRIKTIVNGKPTRDHPWKQPFLPQPRPSDSPIPQR